MEITTIPAEETWELRHKVMWPDKEISYVQLPDDSQGLHYGLFEGGELISVVSLFQAKQGMQFRKFATAVHRQGKGYGTCLLRFLIDEARQRGAAVLWCNARRNKTGFYEKLGFRETDEVFVKDGVEYSIMLKSL